MRSDPRVTGQRGELLSVTSASRQRLGVVNGTALGGSMLRVGAAIVVLLGNGLDPVVGCVNLLRGPFDVEVAVLLPTVGGGKLPEVDESTSPVHDKMDGLAPVSDDEADVRLVDVKLAGDLLRHVFFGLFDRVCFAGFECVKLPNNVLYEENQIFYDCNKLL